MNYSTVKKLVRNRDAFESRRLIRKLREYYCQFGQLAGISVGWNPCPQVEFYSLNRGLRLEDVPVELEGNSVQVMMYQGACW